MGIAKIGADIDKGMSIGPTCPYLFYQYPLRICPISALYKTRIRLFKFLICYLYLDILLVALSCIVFKISVRHFIRNCNFQVLVYCFDRKTFSCIRCDMIFCVKLGVNLTYCLFDVEHEHKMDLLFFCLYVPQ